MTATALVVEDDDRDMAAIEDTLCSMGHTFERTTNQADALHALSRRAFDYAILDLRIPARPDRRTADVEFGGNLLRELRQQWTERQLPVIVMADDVGCFGMAKWLIEKGATDFVSKPFRSTHELGDVIRRIFKRSQRTLFAEMVEARSDRAFQGGELLIGPDHATLLGVRIISDGGVGHSLSILRLLAERTRAGGYVTRSAEDLADELDVLGGQSAIAGYVRTIRTNIIRRLEREHGLHCDRDDVIERAPSGYRLRDWISVRVERATTVSPVADDLPPCQAAPATGVRLNDRQVWALDQLDAGQPFERRALEKRFQVHTKTAKRDLSDLVRHGLVEYVRSGQGGYYRLQRPLKSA